MKTKIVTYDLNIFLISFNYIGLTILKSLASTVHILYHERKCITVILIHVFTQYSFGVGNYQPLKRS